MTGVVVLSSALSKLTAGLKQLNLSKNSLSAKGEHTHMHAHTHTHIILQYTQSQMSVLMFVCVFVVSGVNSLAQSFSPNTLTQLNLSGNTLKGEDISVGTHTHTVV